MSECRPIPPEIAERTQWMHDARWGVMHHYLEPRDSTREAWRRRVNSFDVTSYAQQLAETGAGWLIFTVGQSSGFYCAPNSTYDELTGILPSKCTDRDLIGELADALGEHGIRLIAYLTANGPENDAEAVEALGYKHNVKGKANPLAKTAPRTENDRLVDFQKKWEAIMRDWSLRWEGRVSGWWVDSCYWNDILYDHREPPNFESFAAALRAGNPEALIAMNTGVDQALHRSSEVEDYTAGETGHLWPVPQGRFQWGAQSHVLSYLGPHWGRGPDPRLLTEFVTGYTHQVNDRDGVVTWDVPISDDGTISPSFLKQLV